ncbi:MAG: tripartite tricarboxylate transporter substrate binding protein [Burkholderiales bacterium]|nr:tripartite tricarboxylate transporter substrate binding protein [Burkholderiales bacterium]
MRFSVRLLAAAALLSAGTAFAQAPYPSQRITLIVPFPPGAATDIIARTLAKKMTETLGQLVIVENKAGATGSIGAQYVAKSAPDGYTMLVGTTSSHTMGPQTMKKPLFDSVKDFKPVTLIAWAPNVLVVNPKVPADSVTKLIELAKAQPGKFNYASSGNGSSIHVAGALFEQLAHVQMKHVPYRGAGPALADLIGGQVDLMFDTVAQSLPHIKAGRLRALGVTTTQRSSSLPDVPTIAEAGLPGYEMAAWIGLLAPAATPDSIVQKVQAEVARIVKTPDVIEALRPLGLELAATSSDEFAALIRKEMPAYAKTFKDIGIEKE